MSKRWRTELRANRQCVSYVLSSRDLPRSYVFITTFLAESNKGLTFSA